MDGFSFDYKPSEPCPFCGNNGLSFQTYLCDGWVECEECGARGPTNTLVDVFLEKSEGNAVEAWDYRGK